MQGCSRQRVDPTGVTRRTGWTRTVALGVKAVAEDSVVVGKGAGHLALVLGDGSPESLAGTLDLISWLRIADSLYQGLKETGGLQREIDAA